MFQESKRKVRANFTAIFEKYSDDTPSDVVDLRTFKIVKDRGQIRNMKERRGVGCAAVWQEVEAGNASLDMFVENAPLPCWADDVEEAEDVDVKHFVSCLRDRSDAMVKVLSQNRALDPSELALWSESGNTTAGDKSCRASLPSAQHSAIQQDPALSGSPAPSSATAARSPVRAMTPSPKCLVTRAEECGVLPMSATPECPATLSETAERTAPSERPAASSPVGTTASSETTQCPATPLPECIPSSAQGYVPSTPTSSISACGSVVDVLPPDRTPVTQPLPSHKLLRSASRQPSTPANTSTTTSTSSSTCRDPATPGKLTSLSRLTCAQKRVIAMRLRQLSPHFSAWQLRSRRCSSLCSDSIADDTSHVGRASSPVCPLSSCASDTPTRPRSVHMPVATLPLNTNPAAPAATPTAATTAAPPPAAATTAGSVAAAEAVSPVLPMQSDLSMETSVTTASTPSTPPCLQSIIEAAAAAAAAETAKALLKSPSRSAATAYPPLSRVQPQRQPRVCHKVPPLSSTAATTAALPSSSSSSAVQTKQQQGRVPHQESPAAPSPSVALTTTITRTTTALPMPAHPTTQVPHREQQRNNETEPRILRSSSYVVRRQPRLARRLAEIRDKYRHCA